MISFLCLKWDCGRFKGWRPNHPDGTFIHMSGGWLGFLPGLWLEHSHVARLPYNMVAGARGERERQREPRGSVFYHRAKVSKRHPRKLLESVQGHSRFRKRDSAGEDCQLCIVEGLWDGAQCRSCEKIPPVTAPLKLIPFLERHLLPLGCDCFLTLRILWPELGLGFCGEGLHV